MKTKILSLNLVVLEIIMLIFPISQIILILQCAHIYHNMWNLEQKKVSSMTFFSEFNIFLLICKKQVENMVFLKMNLKSTFFEFQ